MTSIRSAGLLLAAAAALAVDVLLAEGVLAAKRGYLPAESAPPVAGTYGDAAAPTVRLALVGDSTAAGVGADDTAGTVGGQLAAQLGHAGHHVVLAGSGVSGSRTGDLGPQVSRALLGHPDVVVMLIGANDATHLSTGRRMTAPLREAIARIRAAGIPVVLGTCPDLGGTRAFLRPLRDVHAAVGRRVAANQARAGTGAGAAVVDLAALTGPAFRADPSTLSSDRFHPSARGYALWADALLPAVQTAVRGQLAGTSS